MDDVKSLEASGVPLDSKDEQGRTGIFRSCVELTLKKSFFGVWWVLGRGMSFAKLRGISCGSLCAGSVKVLVYGVMFPQKLFLL